MDAKALYCNARIRRGQNMDHTPINLGTVTEDVWRALEPMAIGKMRWGAENVTDAIIAIPSIVKCVNMHDELVDTVKLLHAEMCRIEKRSFLGKSPGTLAAESVIAKAEAV